MNLKPGGSLRSPGGTYDLIGRAVCCMCGPVAKAAITGVRWRDQDGSWRDIEMAREALSLSRGVSIRVCTYSVKEMVKVTLHTDAEAPDPEAQGREDLSHVDRRNAFC
jgi:hypothetical protein